MKRILIAFAILIIFTLSFVSIIYSYPTIDSIFAGYTIDKLKNEIITWLDPDKFSDPSSNGPAVMKVHPWLALRAIELFEYTYPAKNLSNDQKKAIILGAIEEDFDIEDTSTDLGWSNVTTSTILDDSTLQSERCTNHFMGKDENGVEKGLGGWPSAGYWAFQDERNLTRYSVALSLAKNGQLDGWRFLGHVLHLLQDMSVPAHVRNDGHATIFGMNADNYEFELEEINIIGYYALIPDYLGTPKNTVTPQDLFRSLADYTRNNYFSDNTILKDPKPPESNIIPCLDDSNYICNGGTDIMAYKGALYKLTGDEELYQINDKVVESMFRNLGIKAIEYGAGLINLFYDAVKSTSGGSSGGGHWTRNMA